MIFRRENHQTASSAEDDASREASNRTVAVEGPSENFARDFSGDP
jgi:hypothetical protein